LVFIIDDLALIALLAYTSTLSGVIGWGVGKATEKPQIVTQLVQPVPVPIQQPQPIPVPQQPYPTRIVYLPYPYPYLYYYKWW